MTIRAIAAESKVEIYEARLKDKDQTIAAQTKTIEIAEKQLGISDKIDHNGERVLTIDGQRLIACQDTLAKADARVYSLEHPSFFKEIFAPKQLLKMGGAFYLGRITAK